MRIVFMGTPEFAVPCLQSLWDAGYELRGVFTQPDKPKGRGYTLCPPPVKELAEKLKIPVFQPKSLRNPEAVELVRNLAPDAIVVTAYGKILPKEILEIPPLGCINVHASLLPKYRGAAPIQWAVLNGEKTSGVTTMFMAEGLDTGDMLLKSETEIGPDETAGELHDRLSQMGAELIVKTLDQLVKGELRKIPQDDSFSCYAPMLSKELSKIDWTKPAQEIHNQVRGLCPWPSAETVFQKKRLKIHSSALSNDGSGKPGTVLKKKNLVVCCGNNTALELLVVQYEGGKRMSGKDFLLGHPSMIETVLE